MDLFSILFLSVLQGISEFLPISSSGHLIIFSEFLNINFGADDLNTFIVYLHFGTLLAVLVYFRSLLKDTLLGSFKGEKDSLKLGFNIVLTSIPAVLFGAAFSIFIEDLLTREIQFFIASGALMIVGVLFIFSEKLRGNEKIDSLEKISKKNAVIIGLFQALGIIYGVSRSGITILGARAFGLSKKASLDYAFFASIPVILGATLHEFISNLGVNSEIPFSTIVIGILISFISGYVSISFLLNYLKDRSLKTFGIYCLGFGFISLIIYLV